MTYPLDIPAAINQHTNVSRTLAFTLLHIAFTELLMVALLMYAPVTFRRRPPSFPNGLEYTDKEKESFRKAMEATFGKAVLFPRPFHELTSLDFLVIPPNEFSSPPCPIAAPPASP